MNDARVWDPVTAALAGGRTCIVAPTHLHDSIAASARAAIASMPPGRFAVAGFSLGGYVAQEVCRQASDRIAGLGLVGSGARADSEEARQVRRRMIQAVCGGSGAFGQVAQGFAAPSIVHPSRLQDRELSDQRADMASCVRAARASCGNRKPRWAAPTPGIGCPGFMRPRWWCAGEDQVTPLTLSQEMASLLPDAELVVVDEAGHMSILEQPDTVVAAVLRWLERVDAVREGDARPASGE